MDRLQGGMDILPSFDLVELASAVYRDEPW